MKTGKSKPARESLRPLLIESATQLLEREGFAGLQARPLAKSVGCSVGTVYNLFGSMDGLILAANAKTLTQMREHLEQTDADWQGGENDAHGRLMALASAYFEFYKAHEKRWAAVFEFSREGDDHIPEWYSKEIGLLMLQIENIIAPLAGAALPEARARIARALWAATHGIVTLSFSGRLGPVRRETVLEDVDVVVKAVVDGLR
jgi:AcrR family transcriptional regulator